MSNSSRAACTSRAAGILDNRDAWTPALVCKNASTKASLTNGVPSTTMPCCSAGKERAPTHSGGRGAQAVAAFPQCSARYRATGTRYQRCKRRVRAWYVHRTRVPGTCTKPPSTRPYLLNTGLLPIRHSHKLLKRENTSRFTHTTFRGRPASLGWSLLEPALDMADGRDGAEPPLAEVLVDARRTFPVMASRLPIRP